MRTKHLIIAKTELLRLIVFIASLFTSLVANANTVKIDGLYYNLDETAKTASVTYYSYNSNDEYVSGNIKIPSSVTYSGNTYSVTSIGTFAFTDCEGLTSIDISKNVTNIDDYAFAGCKNLKSISFPTNITRIGYLAFSDCRSLSSISFPSNLIKIEPYAFEYCNNLSSIIIPSSVTEIGYNAFPFLKNIKTAGPIGSGCDYEFGWTDSIPKNAFSGCYNLISVIIPSSVTKIGDYAFSGCNELNSIHLPSGVKDIGKGAFQACWKLTSVTIPSGVTRIKDGLFHACSGLKSIMIPSTVTEIGDYAFSDCKVLASIDIPSNVTSIGREAFSWCSGLNSIKIPSGVKSIGDSAFFVCYYITKIIICAPVPPVCGEYVFDDINKSICTLQVPEGCEAAYKAADQWKEFFIEGVNFIADNADVYTIDGILVGKNMDAATIASKLSKGIYIINGKKVWVK